MRTLWLTGITSCQYSDNLFDVVTQIQYHVVHDKYTTFGRILRALKEIKEDASYCHKDTGHAMKRSAPTGLLHDNCVGAQAWFLRLHENRVAMTAFHVELTTIIWRSAGASGGAAATQRPAHQKLAPHHRDAQAADPYLSSLPAAVISLAVQNTRSAHLHALRDPHPKRPIAARFSGRHLGGQQAEQRAVRRACAIAEQLR